MTSAPGADTRISPPVPWVLVLVAIVGAEFMFQLDGMIVTVALPGAQAELGLGITSASWVLNGFLVSFGGLLLLSGRVGDLLGHRRVFLAGISLVVVASLIAGLAPNFPMLLVGRILQGAGAAVAGPAGLALLTTVFDGERRQRAFGLYSTVTGLGAASGMVLGGVLTWAGQWRWSLLVNAPLGLILVVIGLRVLPARVAATRRRPLGLPSVALVVAALTAVVYGLVRAADHGWGDTWTIVSLSGGVLLVAALCTVESRNPEPLLPLRIFASRERVGAFANLLLLAVVLTAFVVYTTQYLRTVLGFNALLTGVAVLPFGLALLVTTQVLTKYIASVQPRIRGVIGLVLMAVAVGSLTRLDGTSGYFTGILPQIVLLGVGVGIAVIPFNLIVLSTTHPDDTGVTAGILQTALAVGGSVGIAVLLIPFTAGNRSIAENISGVFWWDTGVAVLGLLVALVFWFGPGTRRIVT